MAVSATDFTAADFTVMSLPCTTVSLMSTRVGRSGLYTIVSTCTTVSPISAEATGITAGTRALWLVAGRRRTGVDVLYISVGCLLL